MDGLARELTELQTMRRTSIDTVHGLDSTKLERYVQPSEFVAVTPPTPSPPPLRPLAAPSPPPLPSLSPPSPLPLPSLSAPSPPHTCASTCARAPSSACAPTRDASCSRNAMPNVSPRERYLFVSICGARNRICAVDPIRSDPTGRLRALQAFGCSPEEFATFPKWKSVCFKLALAYALCTVNSVRARACSAQSACHRCCGWKARRCPSDSPPRSPCKIRKRKTSGCSELGCAGLCSCGCAAAGSGRLSL